MSLSFFFSYFFIFFLFLINVTSQECGLSARNNTEGSRDEHHTLLEIFFKDIFLREGGEGDMHMQRP